MSFFSKLFGGSSGKSVKKLSKEEKAELLMLVEVAPGMQLPQALANHWDDIQKTARKTIKIEVTPADNLSPGQSKFGHYPCIPESYIYPTDRKGKPLYPLAQINCSELPPNDILPTSGYLQFYIADADNAYGIGGENYAGDFKVLFFKEDEVLVCREDMSFLDVIINGSDYPVYTPHSLSFSGETEYVGSGDYHGDNNPYFNLDRLLEQYPSIDCELSDFVSDNFDTTGHKIGGYAYFTQFEPRENVEDIKDYVLLLQIDTDDEIMWGDSGVGNFFIHPDYLKALDFSRVFYTWDCT